MNNKKGSKGNHFETFINIKIYNYGLKRIYEISPVKGITDSCCNPDCYRGGYTKF
jgi:hypothetical protein